MKMKFLLISDVHEPKWVEVSREALAFFGTLEVATRDAAVERDIWKDYALILIDTTSVKDFTQFIMHIRKQWSEVKPVVITASPRWESAREAFRSGAVDYIDKSMSRQELHSTFASILTWPSSAGG